MEQRPFEIVAYQDRHADDFARLNREWLDSFGLYEEADGKHLYSPREYILDPGGEIFIAEEDGRVLGTFGTYYRQSRRPSPAERRGVELLAQAAGVVLAVPI